MKPSRSRYTSLLIFALFFLVVSLLTRLMLLIFEGDAGLYTVSGLGKVFSIGFLYDCAALSWMMIPFTIIALACPAGRIGMRVHKWLSSAVFAGLASGLIFQVVAEFLFWNEFSSRFNFIAVDYLIYTREVFGNIWQSYPIEFIFGGIIVVSLIITLTIGRTYFQTAGGNSPVFKKRLLISTSLSLFPVMFFFALGDGPNNTLQKPAERELAWNGNYSLFRAFRNNDLSYPAFYATLPSNAVDKIIRAEFPKSNIATSQSVERKIFPKGAPIRKNIVLISIESLGSDYVEAFGGKVGLTPNLSGLVKDSLSFHNLYATGLRTVRGLEAITLSVPPTPGRAVPIRTRNKGMMSLGSILNEQGYKSVYLYGGYSFFDNMEDFFSGNGYEVFDRTDIDDKDIHHETIWGVADEDLFTLSLGTIDQLSQNSDPFFAHIMTTSNHRPYTYPEGRIDIPSKTNREGAVKYTDWAIGDFLARAKTKPWFENTVFVLVSDHTSRGRGRIDLPPENYRIPMWFYAPGFIEPRKIESTASLIDVAPTLLALLNVPYTSRFFGQDILTEGRTNQRAFMANYLTVGYLEDDLIVELLPQKNIRVVQAANGATIPMDDKNAQHFVEKAISYYQLAAKYIEDTTTAK